MHLTPEYWTIFIVVRSASLLRLWLRDHGLIRYEEAHRKTIMAVARSLSPGERVEEWRPDGTYLDISCQTEEEGDDGGGQP